MKELMAQIKAKQSEAKGFLTGEAKDLEKSQACMDEAAELQKEFNIEKQLFEADKDNLNIDEETLKGINDQEKAVEYNEALIMKVLSGKKLNAQEKSALLANTVAGENGEEYIIPQDIDTRIRELRRTHNSARDLFNVEQVAELTGRYTYDENNDSELYEFEDGAAITEGDAPKFKGLSWTIKFFGKLLPVSRILLGAERGGLVAYLNRWFMKSAVNTENKQIFETIKTGATPKTVKGWVALKKSINVDLDPAMLIDGVIVTNQTGFAMLDEEVDADGKPVLQENPADRTKKLFQGLPIRVFVDSQLPMIAAGKAPIIYGSTKELGTFLEYQRLSLAVSEHYAFNKNQDTMRVIQGHTMFIVDKEAAIYGTFEATPAPVETP